MAYYDLYTPFISSRGYALQLRVAFLARRLSGLLSDFSPQEKSESSFDFFLISKYGWSTFATAHALQPISKEIIGSTCKETGERDIEMREEKERRAQPGVFDAKRV